MNLFKKLFNREKKFVLPERYKYLEGKDPTSPINFGIKTSWCAVKCNDAKQVESYLNLNNSKECNWIEGTVSAYENGVFILPAINNWVIIHGSIPSPNTPDQMLGVDEFINKLSIKFGEAHLYGNHRVSSSAFWMNSIAGEIRRSYILSDGEGWGVGEKTEIEKEWDLFNSNSPEAENEKYWDESLIPGEDEVLKVAESWSLNPMKLETMQVDKSFGFCGKLSKARKFGWR